MCLNINSKRRLLDNLTPVGNRGSDASLNTHQYLRPQHQVVNRMKKGKLKSKAVLENKFAEKKIICGTLFSSHPLYRLQIPLLHLLHISFFC